MPECVTPWTTYLALILVCLVFAGVLGLLAYMQYLDRGIERRGKKVLQ